MSDPKKIVGLPQEIYTVASLSTATAATGTTYFPIYAQSPNIEIAPPNHPIYGLIGRVASAWAHLEHTLDLIIWDLIDARSDHIACITSQLMGTGNRYVAVESLLRQRNNAAVSRCLESLEGLKNRTFAPGEERNRIIHDPWYLYNTQAAQFRAMPRKDPRFGVCLIDVGKIEELINTANTLSDRAAELRKQISLALKS